MWSCDIEQNYQRGRYLLNNFKEPQLKKSGQTLGSYGVDPLEVELSTDESWKLLINCQPPFSYNKI